MTLEDNLRQVLEAVDIEIAQAKSGLERMYMLRQQIADVLDGPDETEEEPVAEPEPTVTLTPEQTEELRRLVNHTALTMLRKGGKAAVVAALEELGVARVSETPDDQLERMLKALTIFGEEMM